ncbi:DUF4153 domain-containing protein [Niallia sp. 03133]|uniref:DUF4153 domain-containing protein n=1 Tax=Niallia sp. 03133 TaxID=3458060 RepID=UPI004044A5B8
MNRKNLMYVLICLLLAVIAEITLFKGSIGISLSIFVVSFYGLYFYYVKKKEHTHKLLGLYLFICIWLLTLSYVFIANPVFYGLNFLMIAALLIVHTSLLTSPAFIDWSSSLFIVYLGKKFTQFFLFGKKIAAFLLKKLTKNAKKGTYAKTKKVVIGLIIAGPILIILMILLSASDEKFGNFMIRTIQKMMSLNTKEIWIFIRVVFLFAVFVIGIKTVGRKSVIVPVKTGSTGGTWDQTIVMTIIVSINVLYVLFTIVQFRYFFNDVLIKDYTFAAYAKKGFFELMFVTVINIVMIICVNTYTAVKKKVLKILLSIMVLFSFVMLLSSHLRLSLYEEAYGYTYLRLFSHSFLLLLAILFSFSIIKIWMEKLNLIRIFLLTSLLYYCSLNVINIDQVIVRKNIQRYEKTGDIDLQYISYLSNASVPELVDLYKKESNNFPLKQLLLEKKENLRKKQISWQSYNIVEEKAKKALEEVKE